MEFAQRLSIDPIVAALGDPPRVSVAPRSNLDLPVYRWFNYKHSFSAQFAKAILMPLELNAHSTVLDPFCGAGTSLLAAKECGIRSIGCDIMPLSILASSVKTVSICPREARDASARFVEAVSSRGPSPGFAEWFSARPHLVPYLVGSQAEDVYTARTWVEAYEGGETVRNWLLLALLASLEDASRSVKGGAFLRYDANKGTTPLAAILQHRLTVMRADLTELRSLPRTSARAVLADARRLPIPSQSVDTVLTSPPYPNRHDYTRTYYLELAVGFQNDAQIKELRHNSICSHTEAREPAASSQVSLEESVKLNLEQLSRSPVPDGGIHQMLVAYFSDMTRSLKEMYRTLRRGGIAAIVVSEVQYSGVPIAVGEHLEHIGLQCGFTCSRRIVLRLKGNSPQQMEQYGKHALREELLLLEK